MIASPMIESSSLYSRDDELSRDDVVYVRDKVSSLSSPPEKSCGTILTEVDVGADVLVLPQPKLNDDFFPFTGGDNLRDTFSITLVKRSRPVFDSKVHDIRLTRGGDIRRIMRGGFSLSDFGVASFTQSSSNCEILADDSS